MSYASKWKIPFPTYDPITWVGIGLAIFSNALISVSLNIQKYAHNQNEKLGENRLPYHKIRVWWIGMAFNAVGEVGNLVAYGYAEATVVTPIGAVGVIFSVLIATFILKEPFRKIHAAGILCIVMGVVLIVYSKGNEKVIEPDVEEFLSVYLFTFQSIFYCLAVLLATYYVHKICEEKGKEFVIVYAGLCSLIASWTVLGCKAFMAWVRLTTEKGLNQFCCDFPYAFVPFFTLALIVVCAVWSLHYLQQAMRYHDNNKVIPTYYATFTLACMIGAAMVYREFEGTSMGSIFIFCCGCLMAAAGVFAISKGRQEAITEMENSQHGAGDRNGLVEMDELALQAQDVDVVVDEGAGMAKKQTAKDNWSAGANGHAEDIGESNGHASPKGTRFPKSDGFEDSDEVGESKEGKKDRSLL